MTKSARKVAAKKAAVTRRRRAAGKKAAVTRRRRIAGQKAAVTRQSSSNEKTMEPLHWSEICRSLWMTGQMKDFSKGECWRIRKLLVSKMKEGAVQKVGELYRIEPKLLRKLDKQLTA